jgi:hypothetical protein
VELNVGIFESLLANAVVVVVTSVLFFVNFFIIGHVRRKLNAEPYTAPFTCISKIIQHCNNFCSKNSSKDSCSKSLCSFCCYKQKSIQLMLQRDVRLKFKEKIKAIITENKETLPTQMLHLAETILENIQKSIVERIKEILPVEAQPAQEQVSNAEVRDTHRTLPLGKVIVAVHNGVQQAIEEEIQNGTSLLTPIFDRHNQKELQKAIKVKLYMHILKKEDVNDVDDDEHLVTVNFNIGTTPTNNTRTNTSHGTIN